MIRYSPGQLTRINSARVRLLPQARRPDRAGESASQPSAGTGRGVHAPVRAQAHRLGLGVGARRVRAARRLAPGPRRPGDQLHARPRGARSSRLLLLGGPGERGRVRASQRAAAGGPEERARPASPGDVVLPADRRPGARVPRRGIVPESRPALQDLQQPPAREDPPAGRLGRDVARARAPPRPRRTRRSPTSETASRTAVWSRSGIATTRPRRSDETSRR
jgi:hypothetical protein